MLLYSSCPQIAHALGAGLNLIGHALVIWGNIAYTYKFKKNSSARVKVVL